MKYVFWVLSVFPYEGCLLGEDGALDEDYVLGDNCILGEVGVFCTDLDVYCILYGVVFCMRFVVWVGFVFWYMYWVSGLLGHTVLE